MPGCLAKLEQDARGRADNLEPAKSFPDVTRARILCEDCEQDQEPGGSVGGKTWCQNVWQNYWMSYSSRARMRVHRTGQDVRQAGAQKTNGGSSFFDTNVSIAVVTVHAQPPYLW